MKQDQVVRGLAGTICDDSEYDGGEGAGHNLAKTIQEHSASSQIVL